MGLGATLLRVWASAGSRSKPSDTKIDLGWVNGDDARVEWENERMYTRETLINTITAYLNAGVPLSDLLTGVKTLVGAKLQFNHASDGSFAFLDSGNLGVGRNVGVQAYGCDVDAYGVNFTDTSNPDIQCYGDRIIRQDISSLTWVEDTDQGVNVWVASCNVGTGRLFEGIDYPAYDASCVFYFNSTTMKTFKVLAFDSENVSGNINITEITIKSPLDPNTAFGDAQLFIRSLRNPA